MTLRVLLMAVLLLLPDQAAAQTGTGTGLRQNSPRVHALIGARIVVAPGRAISNGVLVIRDGVIEAVGADVRAPADAHVWDMNGRTLYPGFIDAYSSIGMRTQLIAADTAGGAARNPHLRASIDAAAEFAADDASLKALRAQGFTVAHAVPQVGKLRGQTAVVSLGNGGVLERVIRRGVAHSVGLGPSGQIPWTVYPGSLMGAVAFIRQTLHDASWLADARARYQRNPHGLRRPEENAALAALAPVLAGEQPLIFEVTSTDDALRALAFREEFPIKVWIRGSGHEYLAIDRLRGIDAPIILPVNFPSPPQVATADEALGASLFTLRRWYFAPENPATLAAAGVSFAITADGLTDPRHFLRNVRTAVDRGLAPDAALAALTTVPARYLGIEKTHGTLEPGRVANIVIAEGDLFRSNDARINSLFIDGEHFEIEAPSGFDARGQWRIAASEPAGFQLTLTLGGTSSKLTGTMRMDSVEARLATAQITGVLPQVQLAFSGDILGQPGTIRLFGSATATRFDGWGILPTGLRFNWIGEREGGPPQAAASPADSVASSPLPDIPELHPSGDFGRAHFPEQPRHVLVRNATIWTMGPAGRLRTADLLVTRGRIAAVGANLQPPAGAVIIDGTDKHVTPGLIDPHLHSGIDAANEVGDAVVAEVQVADALYANNIWMYWQLAGGLTTANIMHGSSNPIGGQNQTIKLRWGASRRDQLKFDGAPRTIKFALGDNVTRIAERYPNTRMGTEQIIRDNLLAAQDYAREWADWERTRDGTPPRRDLRLDALVDVLDGDLLVMAHAYRQDEMLMLMGLAEEFGFKVRAFHHAIEAYKLAPELAARGVAAVVWSDWSSFKIEAHDATTYNARILLEAGVLTTLHSDDSNVATRMHWEAAKLLRTGLSEEQALALITINSARVLGIDDRVGSLEVGKDADFVIWSASPLATITHAEQTWIDGRRYFDIEEDHRLREQVVRDRAQLVQAILKLPPGAQQAPSQPRRMTEGH